jgi:hypothetical protein
MKRFWLMFGMAGLVLAPQSGSYAQHSVASPQWLTPKNPANIAPEDLRAWRSAEAADTKDAYSSYLTAFPSGWFKLFAEVRLQPGIPDTVKTKPATTAKSARAYVRDTEAWQASLWQSARHIGTLAAYRDYLLLAPKGADRSAAVQAYIAASPNYPSQRAPDCELADARLNPTRTREGYNGAYPPQALRDELEDVSTGDVLVDYRGSTLAWLNGFHVNPAAFANHTETVALARGYRPLRAGCIDFPTVRSSWAYFLLASDSAGDRRPTPDSADATVLLDTETTLSMPPDRALLLAIPHDGSRAIYKVAIKSSFPTQIRRGRGNQIWSKLANNTHFGADGQRPVMLRVSAPARPIQTNPDKQQLPPFQGPITVLVSRVHAAPPALAPQDKDPKFE